MTNASKNPTKYALEEESRKNEDQSKSDLELQEERLKTNEKRKKERV